MNDREPEADVKYVAGGRVASVNGDVRTIDMGDDGIRVDGRLVTDDREKVENVLKGDYVGLSGRNLVTVAPHVLIDECVDCVVALLEPKDVAITHSKRLKLTIYGKDPDFRPDVFNSSKNEGVEIEYKLRSEFGKEEEKKTGV